MQVPLSRPDIGEREVALVNEVLESSQLALGPKMVEFEAAVARYAGRRFGVAVNSGTSGLHLLVRAYGIGVGDEVISTPFSFIASSNAILYEDASPVFVDVEPATGNIDPALIEAAITPRTKAILPVDAFGQPARLDEIRAIADRHGLVVIDDACEAIGSEWKGVRVGNGAYSEAAVFAFYPNKQLTTGEGGMIVTDDPQITALCRSLRNQGRREAVPGEPLPDPATDFTSLWLNHERLGFNYRLDELSAALGVAQLGRIDELIEKRAGVARMYAERLEGIEGLRLPAVDPAVSCMSWFVYVVQVGWEQESGLQESVRAQVMRRLSEAGVQCRPYFTPIHLQPFYRERFGYVGGEFPVTEKLGRTSIAIPFHNHLTPEEVEYVGQTLEAALKQAAVGSRE